MKYLNILVVFAFFMSACNTTTTTNTEESIVDQNFNQDSPELQQADQVNTISADPWSSNQLMAPNLLAQKIQNKELNDLKVYSIGFDNVIQGSEGFGPAKDEENLDKFRATLEGLDQDQEIVIYCGCCPFASCPNVRPAFQLLTNMGFTNAKLLDLRENIKVDWLDLGYPSIQG